MERRFVWLISSALPSRVSLSWDPMLRHLIQQRPEAWRGLWTDWQWSQGPARIWGDLEKNMATLGMSFSHFAKPVCSISLLSWRWGGWQRCCCANLATNQDSHLRRGWGTSGTWQDRVRAPVTWTDKHKRCSAYLKCSSHECQQYNTEELLVFGLMDTDVQKFSCVFWFPKVCKSLKSSVKG